MLENSLDNNDFINDNQQRKVLLQPKTKNKLNVSS